MTMATSFIISTDLDGTLLDHHDYSWQAAAPALSVCREAGVPVILNTSKTQVEAEAHREDLNLIAPVIVENGSALLVPLALLKGDIPSHQPDVNIRKGERNLRIVFGVERSVILGFVNRVRNDYGWKFEGFNDWSVEEIASLTGLSHSAALAASAKQHSEPLLWNDSAERLLDFQHKAERAGFRLMKGGRFYHLQGQTDKAKPLDWLKRHASLVFDSLDSNSQAKLICLGDNHNDVAMLNIADFPVCVRSPVADFPSLTSDRPIIYTELEGPQGWNVAVQSLLT